MRRSTLRPWTARTLALLIVVSSWRVASAYQPADDNPQQFQDVACYKDDKKFWKGQESVVNVNVALSGSALGNGTGWIVKGKDPNKVLLMTASHNFTDAQAAKAGITVKLQRPDCGGFKKEMLWFASIDEVLERNTKLDFQIDSLKPPPQGKTYPPPLQPLYTEIKPDLIVSLPQHPAE